MRLYRCAEVSDAPDLEGAGGLGTVYLEIDRGASHFGQSHAVTDRGLLVQGSSRHHRWEKGKKPRGSGELALASAAATQLHWGWEGPCP